MIHTATLTYSPASKEMFQTFIKASGTVYYQQDNRYINTQYKADGLIISAFMSKKNNYTAYVFICRVNFKRLIEKQNRIEVYTDADYNQMQEKFNQIMQENNLPLLEQWNTNRIDYCINIRTPYVKEYIKLMQKGDIPYSQRRAYDKKNRNYSTKEGSVYLPAKARDGRSKKTGSITINFYDKQDQLKKEQQVNKDITDEIIAQAKDILRLEVQCNKPKLEYIKSKYHLQDKKITSLLSAQISFDVLERAILGVVRNGDYHRRSIALATIDSTNYTKQTKDKLKDILKRIARQYKSIWKIREELEVSGTSRTAFNEYLKKIQAAGVNPVMLSESRQEKIQNIYDLFFEAFNEELYIDEIEDSMQEVFDSEIEDSIE